MDFEFVPNSSSNWNSQKLNTLSNFNRYIYSPLIYIYNPIQDDVAPEFCMGVQIGEDRLHSYHTLRSSTNLECEILKLNVNTWYSIFNGKDK